MLTRNYLKRLFEDTDINIPVTIFTEPLKKEHSKLSWFNTIRECLCDQLLISEQVYTFQITSIKGKIYTIHSTGTHFIEELQHLFLYKDPLSIRVDILEDSDRSWIILVKSDL